jgi:hypothetical protein
MPLEPPKLPKGRNPPAQQLWANLHYLTTKYFGNPEHFGTILRFNSRGFPGRLPDEHDRNLLRNTREHVSKKGYLGQPSWTDLVQASLSSAAPVQSDLAAISGDRVRSSDVKKILKRMPAMKAAPPVRRLGSRNPASEISLKPPVTSPRRQRIGLAGLHIDVKPLPKLFKLSTLGAATTVVKTGAVAEGVSPRYWSHKVATPEDFASFARNLAIRMAVKPGPPLSVEGLFKVFPAVTRFKSRQGVNPSLELKPLSNQGFDAEYKALLSRFGIHASSMVREGRVFVNRADLVPINPARPLLELNKPSESGVPVLSNEQVLLAMLSRYRTYPQLGADLGLSPGAVGGLVRDAAREVLISVLRDEYKKFHGAKPGSNRARTCRQLYEKIRQVQFDPRQLRG